MKKTIYLILLGMLVVMPLKAQLGEAIANYSNNKFNKAKEEIDACLDKEEYINDPRMWHYRGQIYTAIAQNPTKRYGGLKEANPDAIYVAYEAYQKAMELDPQKQGYYKIALTAMETNLHPIAINEGVVLYKVGTEAKKRDALKAFELAQKTNAKSLIPFIYGGDVARELNLKQKYEAALQAIRKFHYSVFELLLKKDELVKFKNSEEKKLRLQKEKAKYIAALLFYYRDTKEYEKGVEVVDEAVREFPTDERLQSLQVEFHVNTNKLDNAIANLEDAIAKNPTIVGNYINLGIIYEKGGFNQKAEENYKKALAIEPGNYNANFNLGALAYNQAAIISKKIDRLTLPEYIKDGRQLEKQVVEEFKKGLPYFEKLYNQNPEDRKVIFPLGKMYDYLSKKAKSGNEEYAEKLKKIRNN